MPWPTFVRNAVRFDGRSLPDGVAPIDLTSPHTLNSMAGDIRELAQLAQGRVEEDLRERIEGWVNILDNQARSMQSMINNPHLGDEILGTV